jgi:hypothetical protein
MISSPLTFILLGSPKKQKDVSIDKNSLRMSPKRKVVTEPQNFGNIPVSAKPEEVKEEVTEAEN